MLFASFISYFVLIIFFLYQFVPFLITLLFFFLHYILTMLWFFPRLPIVSFYSHSLFHVIVHSVQYNQCSFSFLCYVPFEFIPLFSSILSILAINYWFLHLLISLISTILWLFLIHIPLLIQVFSLFPHRIRYLYFDFLSLESSSLKNYMEGSNYSLSFLPLQLILLIKKLLLILLFLLLLLKLPIL